MTIQQTAVYIASLMLASANALAPHALPVDTKSQAKMVSHLFQSKPEPRIKRTTIYDGPFKHGSPMLTHQEDSAAISDCFDSFHLPNGSSNFSSAL